MKTRIWFPICIALVFVGLNVLPVQADGIIIPDPCPPGRCIEPLPLQQLSIKYHHVTVKIENQVAVTHVDQVFYNPNSWTVEGTYVFPLPVDAVVTNFILWMDNEPIQGQVLDANQARQTYEQIVSQLKDPALLEYIGRGAVQARIYPIAPGEERRIELEYSQALTSTQGLLKYVYPLNTEKFSTTPLDSVSVTVEIHSSQPIRAVYSPSHTTDVVNYGKYDAVASYEESYVTPDTDFTLFWSVGATEAFHLLSYRDPGDSLSPDGFFMLMLAPKPDINIEEIAKDVIIILDRSGSMDGEKIYQAQQAATYIIEHLNLNDRFNIIAFNTDIESFAYNLQPVDKATSATDWLAGFGASGSTDINRALLEASSMVESERPTYLIFLTDGLPTEGETDSQRIIDNFSRQASSNVRLFTFGVGVDVDTFLLDSISMEHHGLSTYVSEGQSLNEVLSSFYDNISTPVLTNVELDFGGISTYDVFPNPLPDLFSGNQVIIVGRYRNGGKATIHLIGEVNGEKQTFTFENQEFSKDNHRESDVLDELPRLWATRKIGYLLNEIRLKGTSQELIDQIIQISVRFGIVTPYTSFLVTEPSILGAEAQERVAQDTYGQMLAQPTAPVAGAPAVQKAADQGAMSQANIAEGISSEGQGQVKIVGAKTFVLQNGVWTDTSYDPENLPASTIPFLSEGYFNLLAVHPEIGAELAIGKYVILVVDGKAYEVVDNPDIKTDIPVAPGITPTPNQQVSVNTLIPTEKKDSGKTPCLGGFLPIAIIILFIKRLRVL
jgi:Ca-activated chloride channel family protein